MLGVIITQWEAGDPPIQEMLQTLVHFKDRAPQFSQNYYDLCYDASQDSAVILAQHSSPA